MTTIATSAATATATASALASNALQKLGGNFTDFLNLLLTQLKSQDPTTPLDTNQFTSELVQFTGVQQSVATNTNLSQLIQLTQGNQMLQSAQLIGKHVSVTSNQVPLQGGHGEVDFTATAGQPVTISIVDASGNVLRDASVTAQAGSNVWSWDGKANDGSPLPDGAYGVSVTTATAGKAPTALAFDVVGVATGVSNNGTVTQLELGGLAVDLSAVHSLSAS